jgi:hypothetical protein
MANFNLLLNTISVEVEFLGSSLLLDPVGEDSLMETLKATTIDNHDVDGIVEARLDDVKEDGTHVTLVETFLDKFEVSEEDRETLDVGFSITIEMPGIEYVEWMLMRYGCMMHRQQELSKEYMDWCFDQGLTQ